MVYGGTQGTRPYLFRICIGFDVVVHVFALRDLIIIQAIFEFEALPASNVR